MSEIEPRQRFGAIANAIRAFRRHSVGSGDDDNNDVARQPPLTTNGDMFEDREEPPLSQITLNGYNDDIRHKLLDNGLAEEIRALMPTRLQLYDTWSLVYTLERHGASLHTLYDKCKPPRESGSRCGYVLALRDAHGYVFGAYANESFRPTEHRRFHGNGESFLWKTTPVGNSGDLRFQAFPYTGLNDYIIYCTHSFLSMGGGDAHYGLWIDDNLNSGESFRSLTFGNEPLSGSGNKFQILSVEVWRVGG